MSERKCKFKTLLLLNLYKAYLTTHYHTRIYLYNS